MQAMKLQLLLVFFNNLTILLIV